MYKINEFIAAYSMRKNCTELFNNITNLFLDEAQYSSGNMNDAVQLWLAAYHYESHDDQCVFHDGDVRDDDDVRDGDHDGDVRDGDEHGSQSTEQLICLWYLKLD